MRITDKLILWGAWSLMAVLGAYSAWKTSQTPRIAPEIVTFEKDYSQIWNKRTTVCGGPTPEVPKPRNPNCIVKEPAPTHDWTAFLATKYVGIPVKHPDVTVFVLSLPVPALTKTTLDETTISWSLTEPKAELKDWMKRKASLPTGFIIKRQCENDKIVEIDSVGPKATSYTDFTTKPRLTYRYWVVAKGSESDLTQDPPPTVAVEKGLDASAKTRTPADTRVKLVGGDKVNGILLVEIYDKAQKKWIPKTAMAAPGKEIGKSGWTLRGLRFDNFTLVADVTDDEGVDRVLTTKD